MKGQQGDSESQGLKDIGSQQSQSILRPVNSLKHKQLKDIYTALHGKPTLSNNRKWIVKSIINFTGSDNVIEQIDQQTGLIQLLVLGLAFAAYPVKEVKPRGVVGQRNNEVAKLAALEGSSSPSSSSLYSSSTNTLLRKSPKNSQLYCIKSYDGEKTCQKLFQVVQTVSNVGYDHRPYLSTTQHLLPKPTVHEQIPSVTPIQSSSISLNTQDELRQLLSSVSSLAGNGLNHNQPNLSKIEEQHSSDQYESSLGQGKQLAVREAGFNDIVDQKHQQLDQRSENQSTTKLFTSLRYQLNICQNTELIQNSNSSVSGMNIQNMPENQTKVCSDNVRSVLQQQPEVACASMGLSQLTEQLKNSDQLNQVQNQMLGPSAPSTQGDNCHSTAACSIYEPRSTIQSTMLQAFTPQSTNVGIENTMKRSQLPQYPQIFQPNKSQPQQSSIPGQNNSLFSNGYLSVSPQTNTQQQSCNEFYFKRQRLADYFRKLSSNQSTADVQNQSQATISQPSPSGKDVQHNHYLLNAPQSSNGQQDTPQISDRQQGTPQASDGQQGTNQDGSVQLLAQALAQTLIKEYRNQLNGDTTVVPNAAPNDAYQQCIVELEKLMQSSQAAGQSPTCNEKSVLSVQHLNQNSGQVQACHPLRNTQSLPDGQDQCSSGISALPVRPSDNYYRENVVSKLKEALSQWYETHQCGEALQQYQQSNTGVETDQSSDIKNESNITMSVETCLQPGLTATQCPVAQPVSANSSHFITSEAKLPTYGQPSQPLQVSQLLNLANSPTIAKSVPPVVNNTSELCATISTEVPVVQYRADVNNYVNAEEGFMAGNNTSAPTEMFELFALHDFTVLDKQPACGKRPLDMYPDLLQQLQKRLKEDDGIAQPAVLSGPQVQQPSNNQQFAPESMNHCTSDHYSMPSKEVAQVQQFIQYSGTNGSSNVTNRSQKRINDDGSPPLYSSNVANILQNLQLLSGMQTC